MLVTRIVGIPGKERRAPSGPASRGKSQFGNTENAPLTFAQKQASIVVKEN